MTFNLTSAGQRLLLNIMSGGTINFTKIQVGNGERQDVSLSVGLSNPLITTNISEIEQKEDYVLLKSQLDNNIEDGFRITEIGVFAEDEEGNEFLYQIGYDDDREANYVPPISHGAYTLQFELFCFVDNAQNVTATINSSLVYASKQEFNAHTVSQDNPHMVTAEQVGLGNVPNVSTNNQVPDFTSSNTLLNIESGERLSVLFGKIKTAIARLITHLSASNPHSINCTKIGAAASRHTHPASDINSGTLSIARGGTGGNTAALARANLGLSLTNVEISTDSNINFDGVIKYLSAFNICIIEGKFTIDAVLLRGQPIILGTLSNYGASNSLGTRLLTMSGNSVVFVADKYIIFMPDTDMTTPEISVSGHWYC